MIYYSILLPLLLAMSLSLYIIPRILVVSVRKELYDEATQERRGRKKRNVPRLGGVSLFPILVISVGLPLAYTFMLGDSFDTNGETQAYFVQFMMMLAGLTTMYLVGVMDDLVGVSLHSKLIIEFLAAMLIPLSGLGINDLNGMFGTAKLVHRHGKFFLHVPVTKEINALSMSDVSNIVGVDRGIRFLAATYNSNGKSVFCSGNAVKEKRAHYKALRKQLQQVGTPSSRRRLKALGQRENRWMRDVNHCVSKALVENNPEGTLFVLEDLNNIRKATERVCKDGRYVSVSWAYFDLEQKLKYKALKNRQLVVNVDPAYTSQTCPKCGHVAKSNRDKKKHLFCCENCGYTSNDDRIGAMNLHRMGIEYLVQCQGSNAPLAG